MKKDEPLNLSWWWFIGGCLLFGSIDWLLLLLLLPPLSGLILIGLKVLCCCCCCWWSSLLFTREEIVSRRRRRRWTRWLSVWCAAAAARFNFLFRFECSPFCWRCAAAAVPLAGLQLCPFLFLCLVFCCRRTLLLLRFACLSFQLSCSSVLGPKFLSGLVDESPLSVLMCVLSLVFGFGFALSLFLYIPVRKICLHCQSLPECFFCCLFT